MQKYRVILLVYYKGHGYDQWTNRFEAKDHYDAFAQVQRDLARFHDNNFAPELMSLQRFD